MTPEPPPMIAVGDTIARKYVVERILGQGAMGVVVAAMHTELQERRAIKFMLPTVLGDADGVERFKREARACSKLKSKHVATIYDVDRLDNGAYYIVMEYLEGKDLKELLTQQRVLPVPVAVDYVLQALEAIGEAHQAGVVHRDLKPANMYLTTGVGGAPCIKVLDFGIAKLAPAGAGPEQNEMTKTEMIMGSPLYMSPEQMKSSRYVDARSDLWAIGVTLYRMVTGVVPFNAGSQVELFAVVLKDNAPPPTLFNPNLPPGFEAIILKCLEKDAAKRFNSAAELALALRPYLNPNPNPHELEAATQIMRAPAPSIPNARLSDSGGVQSQSASFRTAEPAPASTQLMARSNPAESETMHVMAQSGTALINTGSNPAISARASAPSLSGSVPPNSAPTSLPAAPALRASSPSGPGGQTGTAMSETIVHAPQAASKSHALAIAMVVTSVLFLAGIVFVFMSRNNAPATPALAAPTATTAQPTTAPLATTGTQPAAGEVPPAPAIATNVPAPTNAPQPTVAAPALTGPLISTTGQTQTTKALSTSLTAKGFSGGTPTPTATTTSASPKPSSDPFARERYTQ